MKCQNCKKLKADNKIIKGMFSNMHDYLKKCLKQKIKQKMCKHKWYHLIPAVGTTLKKRVPWLEIQYCLKCSYVLELKRSNQTKKEKENVTGTKSSK